MPFVSFCLSCVGVAVAAVAAGRTGVLSFGAVVFVLVLASFRSSRTRVIPMRRSDNGRGRFPAHYKGACVLRLLLFLEVHPMHPANGVNSKGCTLVHLEFYRV